MKILLKHEGYAYPLHRILNMSCFDLYSNMTLPWNYIVMPFFLLFSEAIVGIAYSGHKKFNPYNLDEHWYKIHIAKVFKDRILTCGSISKERNPLGKNLDMTTLLCMFSSSISFLHDTSSLCRANTTYIPVNDLISLSVGVMIGRLSSGYSLSPQEHRIFLERLKEFHLIDFDPVCAEKRRLRYLICRFSDDGRLQCLVKSNEVMILGSVSKRIPREGATGVFIVLCWRSKDSLPIIVNVLECLEEEQNPKLHRLALASHALMLAYTLVRKQYIPLHYFEYAMKGLMGYFKQRLVPPIADFSFDLNDLLKELESLGLVVRLNNCLYWFKGPQFVSSLKMPLDLKRMYLSKMTMYAGITTARDLIVQGIDKGCYLVV